MYNKIKRLYYNLKQAVTYLKGNYLAANIMNTVFIRTVRLQIDAPPKRCIKMSTRITPTLPSPLRGGGLGWGGKGHRR